MIQSESIGSLAGALAIAQGKFKPVVKNKTVSVKMKSGGKYSYSYADLADIIAATATALAEEGLSLTQHVDIEGCFVRVETVLMHSSGEWMRSSVKMQAEDSKPQSLGSAITYARRYATGCVLNVASEADEDGNLANGNEPQPPPNYKRDLENAQEIVEQYKQKYDRVVVAAKGLKAKYIKLAEKEEELAAKEEKTEESVIFDFGCGKMTADLKIELEQRKVEPIYHVAIAKILHGKNTTELNSVIELVKGNYAKEMAETEDTNNAI